MQLSILADIVYTLFTNIIHIHISSFRFSFSLLKTLSLKKQAEPQKSRPFLLLFPQRGEVVSPFLFSLLFLTLDDTPSLWPNK